VLGGRCSRGSSRCCAHRAASRKWACGGTSPRAGCGSSDGDCPGRTRHGRWRATTSPQEPSPRRRWGPTSMHSSCRSSSPVHPFRLPYQAGSSGGPNCIRCLGDSPVVKSLLPPNGSKKHHPGAKGGDMPELRDGSSDPTRRSRVSQRHERRGPPPRRRPRPAATPCLARPSRTQARSPGPSASRGARSLARAPT
jgi:hypothetical protein